MEISAAAERPRQKPASLIMHETQESAESFDADGNTKRKSLETKVTNFIL